MTACGAKGENEKRKSIDEKEWIRNQVILVNVFTVLTLESLAWVSFNSLGSPLFLYFLTGWGKVKKSPFLFSLPWVTSAGRFSWLPFIARLVVRSEKEDCILRVSSSLSLSRNVLLSRSTDGSWRRNKKREGSLKRQSWGSNEMTNFFFSCLSRRILSTLVTLEVAAADITSSFQSSSLFPASSSIFISAVFCEFLSFLTLCTSWKTRFIVLFKQNFRLRFYVSGVVQKQATSILYVYETNFIFSSSFDAKFFFLQILLLHPLLLLFLHFHSFLPNHLIVILKFFSCFFHCIPSVYFIPSCLSTLILLFCSCNESDSSFALEEVKQKESWVSTCLAN